MTEEQIIKLNLPLEQIHQFCQNYPIKRLSIFGSFLRDDFTAQSDVDLLVDYETDKLITLLDMASQEIELSQLIGRPVDLRTSNELSSYFRQEVLRTAQVIYERD
ncbi:MAG: nucleotidyltransferase family protein [Chloroflexota bacterium]